ncbi:MAG: GIY-YIG nuclease family protein [Alphaproteobacteria bacterium]|nr:GIY-YIG nuclease family protein [Alphaproteobacteria bacterium]
MEQYYVYILTNKVNTTLYIGVTNNLIRRIYEHKHKLIPGFSSRYHLVKLVYYEIYEQIENAISREKQLKNGNRERKINLINSFNPGWKDIYDDICR